MDDETEVEDGSRVTIMKCDLYPTKDLKFTPYRAYCVMLDDDYYLDAAEMINEWNYGAQINDPFDNRMYNVIGEGLKNSGESEDEWIPVVQIMATRKLKPKEELYLEYGKQFWCYRGNFDKLPVPQQLKCQDHYNIELEDFIDEVEEPRKKRKATNKPAAGKKTKK